MYVMQKCRIHHIVLMVFHEVWFRLSVGQGHPSWVPEVIVGKGTVPDRCLPQHWRPLGCSSRCITWSAWWSRNTWSSCNTRSSGSIMQKCLLKQYHYMFRRNDTDIQLAMFKVLSTKTCLGFSNWHDLERLIDILFSFRMWNWF